MLLIDTSERQKNELSERKAGEAARLERAERRRMRLRDAGLIFGILSIVGGILLAVLLAPRGPLGAGGDESHEASRAAPSAVAAAPTAAEANGDMVKGSVGVLATEDAPSAGMEH